MGTLPADGLGTRLQPMRPLPHRMGFITAAQLRDSAAALGKTDYGAYLKHIADEA